MHQTRTIIEFELILISKMNIKSVYPKIQVIPVTAFTLRVEVTLSNKAITTFSVRGNQQMSCY